MSALLDLAERCEAATGPDRELDELISAAIQDAVREVQSDGRTAYHSLDGSKWVSIAVGSYTASFDAAMTLVPEGLHVVHAGEARFMTRAPAFAVTVEEWAALGEGDDTIATYPVRRHGVAGTFPLALCAAALRARAAEQSSLNREGGNG